MNAGFYEMDVTIRVRVYADSSEQAKETGRNALGLSSWEARAYPVRVGEPLRAGENPSWEQT